MISVPPRLARLAALTGASLALAASAFAQDVAGSKDHPMVTRYPGQVIAWTRIENFMPYKVPAGPVEGYRNIPKAEPTQGRVTRIFYKLENANRTHTEVWKNYSDALKAAGFTILAEGVFPESDVTGKVGARGWQEQVFRDNPWGDTNAPVQTLIAGQSDQKGSGAVVAKKVRAEGAAYVVVNVEQHTAKYVGALVDVIEVGAAQSGLVAVNADAIGKGIAETGRVVLDGVFFDYDKASLQATSKPAFDAIAQYLKANPTRNFYVVGHTDSRGTFAYNSKLSDDRAHAVADKLIKDYGIASARLESYGVGPLNPVFSNASDAGREKNRRVELVERLN